MRILVLSKRQYTGKDLLSDRYGRLFEIPAALARRGHDVLGVANSYRLRDQGWYRWSELPAMHWLSVNSLPAGIWHYPRSLTKVVRSFRPDVIWACSDAPHAVSGAALAKLTGLPLVVDLYDDFESFRFTKLPGIRSLLRRACCSAEGLTIVSQTLRNDIITTYGVTAATSVVGNGVRKDLFYPRDKQLARKHLRLPMDAKLIGTAGAISAHRDIATLFKAFLKLADSNPTLHLVLAGPRDSTLKSFPHKRVIDLGVLPYEEIPSFYSALDVAAVCNKDTRFGRNCFPLKLYEILASGTPVVAAKLGDVKTTLAGYPTSLYSAGDVADLAEKLSTQLTNPTRTEKLPIPSWDDWSVIVENTLSRAINSYHINSDIHRVP